MGIDTRKIPRQFIHFARRYFDSMQIRNNSRIHFYLKKNATHSKSATTQARKDARNHKMPSSLCEIDTDERGAWWDEVQLHRSSSSTKTEEPVLVILTHNQDGWSCEARRNDIHTFGA